MAVLQKLGVRDTDCKGLGLQLWHSCVSCPGKGIGTLAETTKRKKPHKPKEAMGKIIPDKNSAQDGKSSSLRLDLISSSFPVIVSNLIQPHLFPQIWVPQGVSATQVMALREASSSSRVEFPQDTEPVCSASSGPPLSEGVQPHSQGSPLSCRAGCLL